ncbi:hypothetical protein SARC_05108 [Sphaeroforma arctica JP610]|uniref:Uncharacterized protein n=1 Tax=Sphaeroforma arctica JP610 TaxID=667725 RepID=A0A0L0G1E5_9EUKA|nr:hypothetical protein SARC_05108 [Sphaeroforma arctica JP610]KNC82611.1 hypothetical protein SARC_05108 [Sphaeroforma arctica JP610]|eukprot:XP_014156513.1 hypothetical protein SARC_05108 [Sphaeroforma arctica JP610]
MINTTALTNINLFTPTAVAIFWAGASVAIDQETRSKFWASGVNDAQAFDVGVAVFTYQGILESTLAAAALGSAVYYRSDLLVPYNEKALGVALVAHILQRGVFIKSLRPRAEQLAKGLKVPPSNSHFAFLALEVVKLGALLTV